MTINPILETGDDPSIHHQDHILGVLISYEKTKRMKYPAMFNYKAKTVKKKDYKIFFSLLINIHIYIKPKRSNHLL